MNDSEIMLRSRGRWTRIHECGDFVEVRIRKVHARGVFGCILFGVVTAGFAAAAMRSNGGLDALIAGGGLTLCGAGGLWLAKQFYRAIRFPVVLRIFDLASSVRQPMDIAATDVRFIEIEENWYRDSDDERFFQLWLQHGVEEQPVLIFQVDERERVKLEELARRLSDRWRVPLKSPAAVMCERSDWSPVRILVHLLALAMVAFGLVSAVKQVEMRSWPSTTATIIEIVGADTPGTDGKPAIRYQYAVGGVSYESSNFGFWHNDNSDRITEFVDTVFRQKQISCWYDPENPAKVSLINDGVSSGAVLITVFGLFVMGAALFGRRWE